MARRLYVRGGTTSEVKAVHPGSEDAERRDRCTTCFR